MDKNRGKRSKLWTVVCCLIFSMLLWCNSGINSWAMGKATVGAKSGIIREKADKSSEALASVKKSDVLDVISSTQDSAGYTWYKVYINDKDTGYIRADLVTVEGKIPVEKKKEETSEKTENSDNKTATESNSNTDTQNKEENSSDSKTDIAADVEVNKTEAVKGKTKVGVRIRKGPGTKYELAGSALENTEIAITGIAADSDSSCKYIIKFFFAQSKLIFIFCFFIIISQIILVKINDII